MILMQWLAGLCSMVLGPGTDEVQLLLAGEPHTRVEVRGALETTLHSPDEGLWSVATNWTDGWPSTWHHAHPHQVERAGNWTVLHGALDLEGGRMLLRDSYLEEGDRIRVVRRFTWQGEQALERCTLSVRWIASGSAGALPFLPGISYQGNPSGARHPERVVVQKGLPGERSLYEEHRYPMPFASIEWEQEGVFRGAALHTLPSLVDGGHLSDQWWSLGLESHAEHTELLALSGPCATNGQNSVVKGLQTGRLAYPDTWMTMRPGAVVEKIFFLQAHPAPRRGTAFEHPLRTSLDLHRPYSLDGLPTYDSILRDKLRFARTRWRDGETAGFEMYPQHVQGTQFVMGWCGQAAAPGYALLALGERFGDADLKDMAVRSLDTLCEAPVGEQGFPVRYDAETETWSAPDPVSQGQGLENFARAIAVARRQGLDTERWETFLHQACTAHARRILRENWRPASTNEAFLVSPLVKAGHRFGDETMTRAATKAAEHYADRHGDLREPYWGGTLDASCEDKEGAWAAFQAFLTMYEYQGGEEWLRRAEHAMNVFLSYTVVWDIDLPPGRLRDHDFQTRGWTMVSAQNQHLDVYGVLATPEVWRMGLHLDRPELQQLAAVMFRSCGQLIDAHGSQGEQIQHTNFAQHGDLSDVYRLRGGYSEGWTVFWITAHFLNAAAVFEEMGVDLDGRHADGSGAAQEPVAIESRTDVFVSGTEGYHTFRIPSVIVAANGDLVAFAEGRRGGQGDAGNIDLVSKRSEDGGRTWSDLEVVWDDGANTCGNPCPVVDRTTGTIHLLLTHNLGHDHESEIIAGTSEGTRTVWITRSTDHGLSWSAPEEITATTKLADWTWYATGPGAGIQFERGRHEGRLVIPCDHIEAGTKQYYSHVIVSDDQGATWKLGGSSPRDQVNECEVAELGDGRLLLNMRNYDRSKKTRQVCVSADGGGTWTDQHHDEALIEPICQASLRRLSWPTDQGTPGVLAFTNPASQDGREKMTLRLSMDDGQTWPVTKQLYEGGSAYSCLVALPEGLLGCLFEADGYRRIEFVRVQVNVAR